MSDASSMNRVPNLDKLRGFAALSVVLYHVIELTHWKDYPIDGIYYWGRIGWMGVDLFFVISGFVIAFSAWSLSERHGASWGGHYWRRRLTRIVPLYLMTSAIFVTLVQPQWISLPPEKIAWHGLTHLLFVHNLFPGTHGSINGANWSIGVEMQFYLLVFFVLPWIIRAGILKLAVVFIGISWTWRVIVYLLLEDKGSFALFQYTTQLPGALDQFALGILLCKLVVDRRYADTMDAIRRRPAAVLAGGVLTCALVLTVFKANAVYWNNPWMVVFFRTAIGAAALALLLIAITWPWRAPSLVSRPLDFLGEISYGLYLWHLPVILSLQKQGTGGGALFLAKALLATGFLATVSYFVFERHWMRSARPEWSGGT